MNQEAKTLIDSIKPLFEICLKYSERLDLDEIFISKARAKEIIKQIKDLEKQIPKMNKNSMFDYLDNKIKI
jgi:hypothetical protein